MVFRESRNVKTLHIYWVFTEVGVQEEEGTSEAEAAENDHSIEKQRQ